MRYVMAFLAIFAAGAIMCTGFGSIVEATNQKRAAIDVAREVTRQTEIEWSGRVDIAQIEARRDVGVAKIDRDGLIWSSWSWNIGSVIRGLLWLLGALCLVYTFVRVTGFQLG